MSLAKYWGPSSNPGEGFFSRRLRHSLGGGLKGWWAVESLASMLEVPGARRRLLEGSLDARPGKPAGAAV